MENLQSCQQCRWIGEYSCYKVNENTCAGNHRFSREKKPRVKITRQANRRKTG